MQGVKNEDEDDDEYDEGGFEEAQMDAADDIGDIKNMSIRAFAKLASSKKVRNSIESQKRIQLVLEAYHSPCALLEFQLCSRSLAVPKRHVAD